MKLAIDAFNIALPHGTGVASYGRNLAASIGRLGHEVGLLFGVRSARHKVALLNEIALAEPNEVGGKGPSSFQAVKLAALALRGATASRAAHEITMSGRVKLPSLLDVAGAHYWNVDALYLAAEIAFHVAGSFTRVSMPGVDIAQWTYPLPVRVRGALNIYTLHDLVPLRLPYTTADVKQSYYRLCRRIVREADHILTVSECSRQDIISILGAEPNRVTNLYQTSDVETSAKELKDADISRYIEGLFGVGLREYFLFFGTIEPKKNLSRLLEAYLGSGSRTPLVIVGAPGWGSNRDALLLKSLSGLDSGKRVIWLGYLPRDMLLRLIAGARATLFPSLYEGFGLPVLESMMLGTPVLTSAVSSLTEVGGRAPVYVDPYDVGTIAAGIIRLDADHALRAEMAALGRAQAELFGESAYESRLRDFYAAIC